MSAAAPSPLEAIVAGELAVPAAAPVTAIAHAARAIHGPAVCAVLFYGSCRRDGYRDGQLVDLYLLVDDYAGVHGSAPMRWLNWLIPPNVYYLEVALAGRQVRAKYALVSLGQLELRVAPQTLNPYFWARFAQPTGLLWSRDAATCDRVRAALVQAIRTTVAAALPLVGEPIDAAALWTRALIESYRTELRAEKPERARSIVQGDLERYRLVTAALGPVPRSTSPATARRRWFWRRVQGKGLSLLRSAKASLTFAGGADYLAWKISRHTGVPVEFRPWERRHPLLAAPCVLWRLSRRGLVR